MRETARGAWLCHMLQFLNRLVRAAAEVLAAGEQKDERGVRSHSFGSKQFNDLIFKRNLHFHSKMPTQPNCFFYEKDIFPALRRCKSL